MEKIKISFIIPVYNAASYLKRCINSILKQTTFCDCSEIIIIDDGSCDSSGQICDEYAEKYKKIIVYHQNNQGVSVARNNGLCVAKGEWICFIDPDDWFDLNLCKECFKNIDHSVDIIQFGSTKGYIGKKGNYNPSILLSEKELEEIQISLLNGNQGQIPSRSSMFRWGGVWGKFYKLQYLKEKNLLFNPLLFRNQDVLFNLCVYAELPKVLLVEKVLHHYYISAVSVTTKYCEDDLTRSLIKYNAFMKFIEDYDKKEDFRIACKKQLSGIISSAVIRTICHPDNPNIYCVRKNAFIALRKRTELADTIDSVKYRELNFRDAVICFCVKMKWFFLINALVHFYIFFRRRNPIYLIRKH